MRNKDKLSIADYNSLLIPYSHQQSYVGDQLNRIQEIKDLYFEPRTSKNTANTFLSHSRKKPKKKGKRLAIQGVHPDCRHKINSKNRLNSFFTPKSDRVECININLNTEYQKHLEIMKLFSIYHKETNNRTLEFYKNFGIENISEAQIKEINRTTVKNKMATANFSSLKSDLVEDINQNSQDVIVMNSMSNNSAYCTEYKFEKSDIPFELTQQEYEIYNAAEIALRETMRRKNTFSDQNSPKNEQCYVFNLLINYFLHNDFITQPEKSHLNSQSEIDLGDSEAAETEKKFNLPRGGKKGLFIALILDMLHKTTIMKFDDIHIYLEDFKKQRIMFQQAMNPYEHERMEEIIDDLKKDLKETSRKLNILRENYDKLEKESAIKVKMAYDEKERMKKVFDALQSDYNALLDPKQRKDLISGSLKDYKQLLDLLNTSEEMKSVQAKTVSEITKMYDISQAHQYDRASRQKGIGVQTEEEREKVEKYLLKRPY
ncbi:unnamed protein product [Moneuplotes crassus]|uniref:Uncharacterized protein n=1 Tax=Euplotes crassus TaxID=5936 RepID=A0AAD1Y987_EUPCR|nr:unnamed protein product [Moneuplotes crassus]